MSELPWQSQETLERDLIEFFEDMHRHPELSGSEFRTTDRILQVLETTDLELLDTDLNTGAVALLRGASSEQTVVLRADIDALPIDEQTDLPYKSVNRGVHHACGHDFHTAALLGAAATLSRRRLPIPFDILFIFQPAEETATGARAVIQSGVLQHRKVKAFIGLHVNSEISEDEIGVRQGPMSAGVDRFRITAQGSGTHAARPHSGTDVNTTLAQLVLALQAIVSRRVDPFRPSVLSVTRISAGTTWNVLPGSGEIEGTVRTFDADTRSLIHDEILRITQGLAVATDITLELDWQPGPASVINDPQLVDLLSAAASSQGLKVVKPNLRAGGEDFADYLEHGPGVFFLVGSGTAEPNHNNKFAANPRGLSQAASLHVEMVKALASLA